VYRIGANGPQFRWARRRTHSCAQTLHTAAAAPAARHRQRRACAGFGAASFGRPCQRTSARKNAQYALERTSMHRRITFKFRLYIAGDTQNSADALVNLTTPCMAHPAEHYKIEVADEQAI
jgi:hypothetical protein